MLIRHDLGKTMKYFRSFLVFFLALLVISGSLHAQETDSLLGKALRNISEDFKYLATSPTRLDTKSALITAGVIGVTGLLYAYDEQIRDFFQDNQTSFQDNLAWGAEKLGYQYAAAGVALYGAGGYLLKNRKMQEPGFLALESFLVANSISVSVKYATGRARPMRDKGAYSYKPFSFKMSDTGFPSGHTVSAFSMPGNRGSPTISAISSRARCLSPSAPISTACIRCATIMTKVFHPAWNCP